VVVLLLLPLIMTSTIFTIVMGKGPVPILMPMIDGAGDKTMCVLNKGKNYFA